LDIKSTDYLKKSKETLIRKRFPNFFPENTFR
jgi:hypothetical protein